MPFSIQTFGRQDLFFRAQDWTGVDSDGDGIPDWWIWQYFGILGVNATNTDGDGNSLWNDYTNNTVFDVFSFTGIQTTNDYFNFTPVPMQLGVTGYPYYVAVLVDDTNFSDAVWSPYTGSNLAVNLGMTEGWHDVWIGLRGHADVATNAVWKLKPVKLDFTPPQLMIANPTSGTVSVPVIQVKGLANELLSSLTFDISNAAGFFTNQTGYVTSEIYDTNQLDFTTNYFQCYDVPLTNGANTIVIHVTDLAGNTTTSSQNYNLDYSGDHTTPALSVIWPTDGTPIGGSNFTFQAQVDDATATVIATITDNNNTNTVTALVGRDGKVMAQNLPLAEGTNTLTITVTDAAGNVAVTNLTLMRNDAELTMNPLTDDQLNQSLVNVM